METTKQIIITKVKLVKDGIRINYEKYRDSYWDTLQLTSEEKAAPEFYDAFQYLGSHIAAIMSFTGEIMEHRIRPNEVVLAYSSSGELSVKFGFKLYLPLSGESVPVMTPALKEPPSTMKNPTGAEHPEFLATQTWEAVQHLLDETESTSAVNAPREICLNQIPNNPSWINELLGNWPAVLVCCRHILSPMRKEGIPWRIKE